MLNRFRKYQDNFIFSLLILAIVAVMALYGINQLQSDQQKSGGAAAWVNGEPITNAEFGQVLGNTIEQYKARFGGQIDERLLLQFQVPQNTLDQMIRERLLGQQAARLGFRVTDEELATTIRNAPAFQRDGKFDAAFYRSLPNRGPTEKRLREDLLARRMQIYLAGRVKALPDMIDREYQLHETKANLTFARIDLKALASKSTPSAAELAQTSKTTTPEAFKAYYEGHRRDFTTPAAVDLVQIRVGIPFQASADKKEQAKKKIEEIAAQVKPENFEALAKKYSDDEHAKKGGHVGWVNRGTLEKSLEEALSSLKPGEVSKPVETGFGYFLLLVKNTRPEVVKPLEEVKPAITKELWKEKHAQKFADQKKAEWEKKLAGGVSIEPDLKAVGIEVKKTGPFSLGQGYIPQIGQSDDVMDALFTLSKSKPIGPKLYASGSELYFIKLDSIEGPKAAEAKVARESASASVETALQTALIKKWLETLRESAAVRIEADFGASPDA